MHVFDLDPVIELKLVIDSWRFEKKKHSSEVPQAVSMTYKEFSYIWKQICLDQSSISGETYIQVPSRRDIEQCRDKYRIFSMLVFISD